MPVPSELADGLAQFVPAPLTDHREIRPNYSGPPLFGLAARRFGGRHSITCRRRRLQFAAREAWKFRGLMSERERGASAGEHGRKGGPTLRATAGRRALHRGTAKAFHHARRGS